MDVREDKDGDGEVRGERGIGCDGDLTRCLRVEYSGGLVCCGVCGADVKEDKDGDGELRGERGIGCDGDFAWCFWVENSGGGVG